MPTIADERQREQQQQRQRTLRRAGAPAAAGGRQRAQREEPRDRREQQRPGRTGRRARVHVDGVQASLRATRAPRPPATSAAASARSVAIGPRAQQPARDDEYHGRSSRTSRRPFTWLRVVVAEVDREDLADAVARDPVQLLRFAPLRDERRRAAVREHEERDRRRDAGRERARRSRVGARAMRGSQTTPTQAIASSSSAGGNFTKSWKPIAKPAPPPRRAAARGRVSRDREQPEQTGAGEEHDEVAWRRCSRSRARRRSAAIPSARRARNGAKAGLGDRRKARPRPHEDGARERRSVAISSVAMRSRRISTTSKCSGGSRCASSL